MDRILKICFCLILIGIYWIVIADSVCTEVGFFEKCGVCPHNKNCPRCQNIPNVECGFENRCRCKEGYGRKQIGNETHCVKAYKTVPFALSCNTDDILCNDYDNLFCDPNDNNKCSCPKGFRRDAYLRLCINRAGDILDACSALRNFCKNTSICDTVNQMCVVKKGLKYNCTTKGYEEVQEYNEACGEASCSITVKACNPCNSHNHLECRNKTCVCIEGYYWVANKDKCLMYGEYNESCINNKCNPKSNLACKNQTVCDCKEGFKYNEDKKRCIREDKKQGNLLVVVLSVIFGIILIGLLIGIGVWLWHRRRLARPRDVQVRLQETEVRLHDTEIRLHDMEVRLHDAEVRLQDAQEKH